MADPIFCVCGGGVPCDPAPSNVTVSGITQNSANVAFTPNGVTGDIYDLTLTPNSGAASTYPNISNPYTAGSLLANVGYTPSVATRCLSGMANSATGSLFTTLANVQVRAYYQSSTSNTMLTESQILALPLHADFAHNANPIVADWTATTGTPRWLQFYVRAGETLPTAWVENNNPANNGALGTNETFHLLGTVTATDGLGNWNVISSTEVTDFDNPVSFSH